ncbi:MAG: hypothetical protein FWD31_00705 [Planctomycetaceae bacterium]|nr:hypothetical protein [Planctomycetaceae bacterium]
MTPLAQPVLRVGVPNDVTGATIIIQGFSIALGIKNVVSIVFRKNSFFAEQNVNYSRIALCFILSPFEISRMRARLPCCRSQQSCFLWENGFSLGDAVRAAFILQDFSTGLDIITEKKNLKSAKKMDSCLGMFCFASNIYGMTFFSRRKAENLSFWK